MNNKMILEEDLFDELLDDDGSFPTFGPIKRYEMDKIEIANLTEIMKLQYSNICLNYGDFRQFTTIPAQSKRFYPCSYRAAGIMYKEGFILHEKGQTAIWTDWRLDGGTIKIAFGAPEGIEKGWSDTFPFKQEDDVMKIYKIMKLKAFW